MTSRQSILFVALVLSLLVFFSVKADAARHTGEPISTSRAPSEQEVWNKNYCAAFSVVSGRVLLMKKDGMTLEAVVEQHTKEEALMRDAFSLVEGLPEDYIDKLVALVREDNKRARFNVFFGNIIKDDTPLSYWQRKEEKLCMESAQYEGKRILVPTYDVVE